MRPRWRCCSTDAGSVSPWVTISRRSVPRCSPGTSGHTGVPLCSPKAMVREASGSARKIPQRYSGIFTQSKCAQPWASTLIAVRR